MATISAMKILAPRMCQVFDGRVTFEGSAFFILDNGNTASRSFLFEVNPLDFTGLSRTSALARVKAEFLAQLVNESARQATSLFAEALQNFNFTFPSEINP